MERMDTAGSEADERDGPASGLSGRATAAPGTGSGAAARPTPGRRRRLGVLVLVTVLVYAADLVSKTIVVATLAGRPPVRLIGTLLQLHYTRNPGAAFSIGADGYTVVFTLIAVGVVVMILRMARTLSSVRWAIALGLLLGGALGNLTDRMFRSPGPLRGWVVDFIQVPHWPIFNLADSAICCGGALMVLLAFLGLHPDGRDERVADVAENGTAENVTAERVERSGSGESAARAGDEASVALPMDADRADDGHEGEQR